MSNDCALFIIIVPNDFDLEKSLTLNTEKTDVVKPAPRRASIDTISALVVPGGISSAIQPELGPLIEEKNEHNLSSVHQQPSSISICIALQNYLTERNDIEAQWLASDNKKTFQIIFSVEFGFVSDCMLQDLTKLGIGERNGTKIFVLPTTVIFKGHGNEKIESSSTLSSNSMHDMDTTKEDKVSPINEENSLNETNGLACNDISLSSRIRKRIRESSFKKSVRARLMVHQVVANIRASSAMSFDFVLLLCLASMLAAFGLLENSAVIIVASMLVSPLMNPILGIVFGLSVRDQSLWKRGLRNEIIGLIICLTCGFILGLFTAFFETKWGISSSFPTSEMKSRGDGKRLWVGVFIALPSGAGVALSVLGGNTGSLVGVAISASLLPPVVNSGLLFAYSLLAKMFSNLGAIKPLTLNITDERTSSILNCPKYINNDYQPLYTCNLANEAAILAACSLLLTMVNIICIVIMALLILRIKEVVPLHQANKDIASFFHYDVPVARDYNKTLHEGDIDAKSLSPTNIRANHLAQSIISRWKTIKSTTSNRPDQHVQQSLSSVPPNSESANHKNILTSNNIESRRKLYRLETFAKEYDLDIFNKDHYDLIDNDSRDKVRLLITDLLDMYQEIPSVFVNLYHLQPSGTQSSTTDNENTSFYQEIIELLPPRWHQLFLFERQRRMLTAWALPYDRSHSMSTNRLKTSTPATSPAHDRDLHRSLKHRNKKNQSRLYRQNSVPESNIPSIMTSQDTDPPIKSTRFRIENPAITTTVEILGNESKLI